MPEAFDALRRVYGETVAESLIARLQPWIDQAVAARTDELWNLDLCREADPEWFQDPSMIGYVCYADRFADTLPGIGEHLDYLQTLGIRYLHLMPLLKPRAGENDGGYAVQDYRAVDPRLGTMADLRALAGSLRARSMSLCVDLVVNHTAREHEWAVRARAGEQEYRDRYFFFADRVLPDRYEQTLREVFPAFAPGNFTWLADAKSWVWTTFHDYQWDLNYANPDVFIGMLDIIANLANQGVEIVRLDAVPFMWKRVGTDCENQPEAHALLEAFRALLAIVAPAVVFKAEAIVSPDLLVPYVGAGDPQRHECEIAYHNQLMVMLWSSLATHDAGLMRNALGRMGEIPLNSSWVTYVRCHDDIGWAVTDEDALNIGWDGFNHRKFLNDFYSGRYPMSFGRGALFQENQLTGDARISGTAAALCGIEEALQRGDESALGVAMARLELLYAVAYCFGGIPLLYMGDELGLLNDYSFVDDPAHADDNRWMHRPKMDWSAAARAAVSGTLEHRLTTFFVELGRVRGSLGQLHGGARTSFHDLGQHEIFCFERKHPRRQPLWMIANFGEQTLSVPTRKLPRWQSRQHRLAHRSEGAEFGDRGVTLPSHGWVWLVPAD
jgi:amylosucrase